MHATQEQYASTTDSGSETISRFAFAIFASSIFAAAGTPLSAPVFFSLFLAPIATALVFLWVPGTAMGIVSTLASSVTAAIAALLIASYIVFSGEIKGAPSIALASFPLVVATLAVAMASTQPWRVKRRGVFRSYPGLVPGCLCRAKRCRSRDDAKVLENQKNDRKAE